MYLKEGTLRKVRTLVLVLVLVLVFVLHLGVSLEPVLAFRCQLV